jgi:putative transposase
VQYLKGRSSHKLLTEFRDLTEALLGSAPVGAWLVASGGNVTDEVWAEYIQAQQPPEPDDAFRVT